VAVTRSKKNWALNCIRLPTPFSAQSHQPPHSKNRHISSPSAHELSSFELVKRNLLH
jgi:hypothetical protein